MNLDPLGDFYFNTKAGVHHCSPGCVRPCYITPEESFQAAFIKSGHESLFFMCPVPGESCWDCSNYLPEEGFPMFYHLIICHVTYDDHRVCCPLCFMSQGRVVRTAPLPVLLPKRSSPCYTSLVSRI